MAIEKDLLDQLLAGRDPQDLFAENGLVDELKKAPSERLLNAELDEHLIGEAGRSVGNHRIGASVKPGSLIVSRCAPRPTNSPPVVPDPPKLPISEFILDFNHETRH